MSLMKQNKKPKETLDRAQYGLEIIFNIFFNTRMYQYNHIKILMAVKTNAQQKLNYC